ncbi:MAG: asparagine--tRNA ligase [Tissierellia bacterium]|nr:asparagine--tRNA ligase [Tissierellia bacterium]
MELRELLQKYKDLEGQTVEVQGWIRNLRDSKNFGFIELNDGTDFESVQIVFDQELSNFDEVKRFNLSAALEVEGTVVVTPEMQQPFEIKATEIILHGDSAEDYPLQKKRHTREYLRTIAHLRPRTNLFRAVYRVRSVLAFAIHEFFQSRGFVYAHTPLISAFDGEGAGEIFHVTSMDLKNIPMKDGEVDFGCDFFGKPVNLAVTGQLEGETFAQAFRNIYTFGPTFRADKSNTKVHAAEFWMIEPEMAFCDLTQNMEVAEDMMRFIIQYTLEKCPKEMKFFDQFVEKGLLEKLRKIVESEYPRLSYTDAIEILQKAPVTFEVYPEWGDDLGREHERYLAEKHFDSPVFITDYPKGIKAFYMKLNEDGKTVAACDLLVPGIGEIIGGSQREERYDVLLQKMKEFDLSPEDYYWYLDLRKYGTTIHSGFGLGFERMVMYMTGVDNIRDVTLFPRTVNHCEF